MIMTIIITLITITIITKIIIIIIETITERRGYGDEGEEDEYLCLWRFNIYKKKR